MDFLFSRQVRGAFHLNMGHSGIFKNTKFLKISYRKLVVAFDFSQNFRESALEVATKKGLCSELEFLESWLSQALNQTTCYIIVFMATISKGYNTVSDLYFFQILCILNTLRKMSWIKK